MTQTSTSSLLSTFGPTIDCCRRRREEGGGGGVTSVTVYGWILPFPYTLICFFGLVLPYRTPKFLYSDALPKRRIDNFYILTVTKGDNREAVYRSWNAHKHLERLHPCVRVHVLTDEPYFFENVNCYTCPKLFTTAGSKYKARALEWYRQTMRFTEHDWVLHLDEESVIDDESIKAALEFVWYEHDYHWGQGLILYNQYKFWSNWFFTGADAIRVGDDLSRFALQYSYFHAPIFGAHGSFLLNNGAIGIIVQNVDKKINPILIILCIPLTFLLQYAACVMEALAVIYGLISPPSDFDVIKK
ncbi:hypothetical protein BASA62_004354 [Batrachochytrium salamandrivorans]|nr:hypothetical protein BASA62_004354 [Batrachochytrium salamandrivorans]